jgi:predicted AAA+ superfamily ATPase
VRDRLIRERLEKSRRSVLLLGPRQVGKTTLCHSLKPDFSVNLAVETEYLRYSKEPDRLLRELAALPGEGLVLIDEIQRVPSLLNTVQVFLDTPGKRSRFLLTGSSARKLRRGGANLLPGRVLLEHLDPLLWCELGEPFDLDRALRIGMLPGIHLGEEDAADVLGTYAEVYLREEIRAEALTKNLGGYARFLDVMALLSGQWLNYSKVASDTEIPKETVRRFLTLLEDTLLVFRLPSFQPKRKRSRRVTQRDRVLFFDVGVRNALLDLHRRPLTRDQLGPAFEQWFVLQVLYLNRALHKGWTLSSYRTESGAEVDLVVERADDLVGIEIKAGANVGPSDARGLNSLEEVVRGYKPIKKRIAFTGPRAQVLAGDVRACPFLELLDELRRED